MWEPTVQLTPGWRRFTSPARAAGLLLWFPFCVSAVGESCSGFVTQFDPSFLQYSLPPQRLLGTLIRQVLKSFSRWCQENAKQHLWYAKFRWAWEGTAACSRTILHSARALIRGLKLLFLSLSAVIQSVCIPFHRGKHKGLYEKWIWLLSRGL